MTAKDEIIVDPVVDPVAAFSFLDMWRGGMRAIREQVAQEAKAVYSDVWPPAPFGTLGEDMPLALGSRRHSAAERLGHGWEADYD